MDKNVLGDGREIVLGYGDQIPDGPMGTDELKAALAAGPDVPMSSSRGEVPPIPDPIFSTTPIVGPGLANSERARQEAMLARAAAEKAKSSTSNLAAKATGHTPVTVPVQQPVVPPPQQATPDVEVSPDNGPDDDIKSQMVLPSEAEKNMLKKKYPGMLRVVPMPYSREDGKLDCYVLRQLTRSQWRAMEDAARKIAESKPDISANDIFAEKIVCLATVWPDIQEHTVRMLPAGLIPTLFGIVQQMGLFFDPETIMRLTFAL